MQMNSRPIVLLAGALLVGACGEGGEVADNQAAAVDPESTAPANPADEEADARPAEPQDASNDNDAADSDLDAEVQGLLDDLDFGDGGARVVLDGRTYEFALGGHSPEIDGKTYLGTCQTLFGAITGNGYQIEEGGVVIMEFDLPPEDWESYEDGRFDTATPRIKIEDTATEEAWVADMAFVDLHPEVAGASQIDEWMTDGTRASGNATFTAITPWSAPIEEAEPLQGTFELGCADD